jgi:hypothetical protein
MDKVDAKTRETAATLLDVLLTSKAAADAARPVAVNNGVHGNTPITTTLRHGFDTNGWGNNTTVQRLPSTQPIVNKPQDTDLKQQKPEHSTQTILQQQQQQQQQPRPSSTVGARSNGSVIANTTIQNPKHQLQNQNQEKQQHIEQNQSQQPTKIFEQSSFLGVNETSCVSSSTSNTTTPMMIRMTSIGFGVDNNSTSRVDATEATIKAVQDAMERSTLRFQTFHSHSLQIKIQLGVPSVETQTSLLSSRDSKLKQHQTKLQPMNVDLERVSSILPRVIPILPVQVHVGGLFVPGETPSAPSICTVVACITLESQPLTPPSRSYLQPLSSPPASVALPVLPCPSTAHDSSTIGLSKSKEALAMDSTPMAETRVIHRPSKEKETQQPIASCSQNQRQTINVLPTSLPTAQPRPEGDPNPPQGWTRGNFPNKTQNDNRYISETAPIPSSSLLYRTQVSTRLSASPEDQICTVSEKKPEATTATPMSSRKSDVASDSTRIGNKRRHEQTNDEGSQKAPLPTRQDGVGTTNSIEILAMISEQEINRRNVLGAAESSTATSALILGMHSTSMNSSASGDKSLSSSVGTPVTGTCTTSQGVQTAFRCKSSDHDQRPESSFTATPHDRIQALSHDRSNNNDRSNKINNNSNITIGHKNNSHSTTPKSYNSKDGSKNITALSSVFATSVAKSEYVHQPPNSRNRQSNKVGVSRRGGRVLSYSDYSNEHPLPEERDCWALSTRTTSSPVFPLKLHETLTQIENDGYDDIIGWLPHGRSFKIHKQKEFTDIILPRYAFAFVSFWCFFGNNQIHFLVSDKMLFFILTFEISIKLGILS